MGDWTYFGKDELKLQSGGELITDRKGLATGRLAFKVRPGRWDLMPRLNSAHPHAPFAGMEKRVVRFTPGFWQVFCDYAGCEVEESEPVYDFNPGTGNEPIETIDNFVSQVAGKPSAPINGAIFRDPETGAISTNDDTGVFDRFSIMKDGEPNPWAGLVEYLAANNTSWTKSWTRRSQPSGAGRPLQVVNTPPGREPSFDGANYNWLQLPVAYTQRGRAYDCRQVWLLSGPRGWNRIVYNGTED